MESYVQAPQVHKAAVKNPKMLGGPFMDYEGIRKEEIQTLIEKTRTEQSQMIAFAEALTELDAILREKAQGDTLDPFYELMPDILKGYIELVYDLNHNPSFRIFEQLLYHSPYYDTKMQSIAIWETSNDDRSFVLSTARLNDQQTIHCDFPFNHELIDRLAKMKRQAAPFSEISQFFKPEDSELLKSFFTQEPPPSYEKYEGDAIRMRYFGHACILIETKEVSILVDPLISYYGYLSEINHFSDVHLPDQIDYVLITHNHQDHILLETLLPLRHKVKNVIVPRGGNGSLQDPNLKLMLNNIGFDNVIELGELEKIKFEDCTITGLPFMGEHADLDIRTKICHHVRVGEFSMIFAADSCNVQPEIYKNVRDLVGAVDVIFLGMECEGAPLSWVYGPYHTKPIPRDVDQSRRLSGSNCERGMNLVKAFDPKEVYVYAMGLEPWLKFISSIKYTDESLPIIESDKLIAACHEKNIISERLFGEKEILYDKAQPVMS